MENCFNVLGQDGTIIIEKSPKDGYELLGTFPTMEEAEEFSQRIANEYWLNFKKN